MYNLLLIVCMYKFFHLVFYIDILLYHHRTFHVERVIATDLQRKKSRFAMDHSMRTFEFARSVVAISIMSQFFILLGYLITA